MPEPPPSSLWAQASRFAVAGLAASLLDIGVLVLLASGFGLHYLLANTFSFIVGNLTSYAISVLWVFPDRLVRSRWIEFGIFTLVGIGSMGVSHGTMALGVEIVGVHYLIAKGFSVGTTFIWNFTLKKFLLFRSRRAEGVRP